MPEWTDADGWHCPMESTWLLKSSVPLPRLLCRAPSWRKRHGTLPAGGLLAEAGLNGASQLAGFGGHNSSDGAVLQHQCCCLPSEAIRLSHQGRSQGCSIAAGKDGEHTVLGPHWHWQSLLTDARAFRPGARPFPLVAAGSVFARGVAARWRRAGLHARAATECQQRCTANFVRCKFSAVPQSTLRSQPLPVSSPLQKDKDRRSLFDTWKVSVGRRYKDRGEVSGLAGRVCWSC